MSEHVYFLTIGLPLLALLLIVGMRTLASVQTASVRAETEASYQALAEKALAAQTETATALASIEASVAEMKARLVSVERILKEVE
jgi:Tfp pilus assembly protein PilV